MVGKHRVRIPLKACVNIYHILHACLSLSVFVCAYVCVCVCVGGGHLSVESIKLDLNDLLFHRFDGVIN